MGLSDLIKNSSSVHILTNSCLAGSKNKLRGKGNKIENKLMPFRVFSPFSITGLNNTIDIGKCLLQKTEIIIVGDNNKIIIKDNSKFLDSSIFIIGNNCIINIDENCLINNTEIGAEGDGSSIDIRRDNGIGGFVWLGNKTNSTLKTFMFSNDGMKITIDENGRISDGTVIRNSDSHKIIDINDTEVFNNPRDVYIGKHNWICAEALILKGACTGENCIIGARSVLTKDMKEKNNVLIAGNPAKAVKENINWKL